MKKVIINTIFCLILLLYIGVTAFIKHDVAQQSNDSTAIEACTSMAAGRSPRAMGSSSGWSSRTSGSIGWCKGQRPSRSRRTAAVWCATPTWWSTCGTAGYWRCGRIIGRGASPRTRWWRCRSMGRRTRAPCSRADTISSLIPAPARMACSWPG